MLHKTFLNDEVYPEAERKVVEFVRAMNQLTQDEFIEKYQNDIHFHNGVKTLIHIFVQAEV